MFYHRSKKTLLITFIIAVLALPVMPVGATKNQLPSNITVERISSKITRFEETIPLNIPDPRIPEGATYQVSVYGVKVRGGIVLIDCGDDTLAEDLYQAVSMIYSQPIKAVYVTHYHADHAGAGSYFQSMGIPVYAPEEEFEEIQIGAKVQPGMIPDEFTYEGYLPDGDYGEVELERGFEIISAPGHTLGAVHIEYSKGNKNYLFTSDTILPIGTFDPVDPDYTYELTFQTAYQNYQLETMELDPLWSLQLDTLNGMLGEVDDYDLVLNGHTPVLNAEEASVYVLSTIGILNYFPFI